MVFSRILKLGRLQRGKAEQSAAPSVSWEIAKAYMILISRNRLFIRSSLDGAYYCMVMSVRVSVRHSFPHCSPTCFDVSSWNFLCHFLLMNIRSSLSIVSITVYSVIFFFELCPFWNLEYWKYSFLHFSLTCYDILSWNFAYDFVLVYRDQGRVSSICVNFFRSYAPIGTLNTGNTQFSALFSYMLWHIELKF